MYHQSILDLIGNTPLVKINKLNKNPRVTLLAKLEYFNPAGSVKDRIATAMIEKAEKEGRLKKNGTIVEPTSGNTGAGLAMAAALKNYRSIFVMPDKMSDEKRNLLRAYGSKVVITPTAVYPKDERSYYKVSDRLSKEIKGAFKPDQYHNSANPEAHFRTTGPEIWRDTEGKITHFVCGMGTGGTITGVAKYLKKKNPQIKVIGIDPVGSVFYQYKKSGKFPDLMKTYKVEGVGEDFIPSTIDFKYIDEVIQVGDKECFLTARKLARNEGILVGGSSGMALQGALKVTEKIKNGMVVVLLPDSGKSYLSKMYSDQWMRENGFLDSAEGESIGSILAKKRDKKIISLKPEDTVKTAVHLMEKHDISQMAVISGTKIVGKVNERQLLTGLYEKRIGASNKISTILDPQVLSVTEDESIDRVSELLTTDNLVIITDKNRKPKGIVTRIDLIEHYS